DQRAKPRRGPYPPLTIETILEWADSHRARESRWPDRKSGPIPEAHGETWGSIDQALHKGYRGLPAGSSLAQILATYRGVRNRKALPKLTIEQILEAADSYFEA